MNDPDVKMLIFVVLVLGLAGALWYFRGDYLRPVAEPVVVESEPAIEVVPTSDTPVHPIVSPQTAEDSDVVPEPLPPLDDSDSYFVLALIDIFGSDIGPVLVREAFIDKLVATVDNLPRSHVAERIRPVGTLATTFSLDATSDDDQLLLGPDNYERYDTLVNLAAGANLQDVATMYRRYYPLFQESYQRLGYPDAYFNDRVVEVIDHLLEAPEPDEPIRLVRPHVLYQFADVDLEALSSGQKLLLRMGDDNAAKIKLVLQELQALITKPPEHPE